MSNGPTSSEISLKPQIRLLLFFFFLNQAVTLETKSGFRASGKRPKSGFKTEGGDFKGTLAVPASHGIPKGTESPASICGPENTCLTLTIQGFALENLSHGT